MPATMEASLEGEVLDAGVELATLDHSPTPVQAPEEDRGDQLRQLKRRLRPTYRVDLGIDVGGKFDAASRLHAPTASPRKRAAPRTFADRDQRRTLASWGISLMLLLGAGQLAVGLGLLAWSAAFSQPDVWNWALAVTIASEAVLTTGLAWMAVRLWRNSRKLNRQLDGVDRQLDELQYLTSQLAYSRLSGSQSYYEHFGAAASPPVALANLRGQLDQLAVRVARR